MISLQCFHILPGPSAHAQTCFIAIKHMNTNYGALALGLGWNELKALHWATQQPWVYIVAVQAMLQQVGWTWTIMPNSSLLPDNLRGTLAMEMPAQRGWLEWLWPKPKARAICALQLGVQSIILTELVVGNPNTTMVRWNVVF